MHACLSAGSVKELAKAMCGLNAMSDLPARLGFYKHLADATVYQIHTQQRADGRNVDVLCRWRFVKVPYGFCLVKHVAEHWSVRAELFAVAPAVFKVGVDGVCGFGRAVGGIFKLGIFIHD